MRPTPMTRYAVLFAALLALGACGARPADPSSAAGSSASASPSDQKVVCAGPVTKVASADLDGDGSAEQVTFAPDSGQDCPAYLTAGDLEGGTADVGTLQPASMRAVTVPGRTGQLLVVRETHPRGGFQDHVFAYSAGKLAELTVDGHALFPFVATDTPLAAADGFTARCADGGIAVLHAVAHQPIGVVPAFDVVATSYAIDGTTLRATGESEVKDNVLPKLLGSQFPGLVKRSVLTEGCGG